MLKAVLQFAAIFFMRCVSFDSKIYVKWKFMRQLIYAVFRIACMTDQRETRSPSAIPRYI